MEWTFTIPNSTGDPIWIEKSFWLGRLRLTRAGQRLPRLKEKGKPFLLECPGEPNRRILVKRRHLSLDYLPRVLIDGQEIVLDRPLATWEYVVGGLPLVLLFVGGAGKPGVLGWVLGLLGAHLNYRLFRKLETGLGKCLSVLGITVGTLLAYVIVAGVLRGLLRQPEYVLEHMPVFVALKQYDPQVSEQVRKEIIEGSKNKTANELAVELGARLQPLVLKALGQTSDSALLQFGKIRLDMFKEVADKGGATDCVLIVTGSFSSVDQATRTRIRSAITLETSTTT